MRLFTCVDHETHWPVGGASIVIAQDLAHACDLLCAELRAHGLRRDEPFTLKDMGVEVATTEPRAIILRDGDY